jgi:uncharacterized protein
MVRGIASRVAHLDWAGIAEALDDKGFAVTTRPLLTASECVALARGFDDDALFRSTIDMARYRFGSGSYRYYARPLPPVVEELRTAAYPELARIANAWSVRLGTPAFPAAHAELLRRCKANGQMRPTPLLLRYRQGDWNALHQDLYGDIAFPLQIAIPLSRPGVDFDGGEMLYVEQRPRAQSRGHAVSPPRGHAVIFTTNVRPAAGARGTYRVVVRHGASTVTRGERFTLGIIFHDAK